jgi:hypothetical protein
LHNPGSMADSATIQPPSDGSSETRKIILEVRLS